MSYKKEYARLLLFRTVGNFLVLLSLLMVAKIFGPIAGQEIVYAYKQYRGVSTVVVFKQPTVEVKKNSHIVTPTPKPNAFASVIQKLQTKEEVIVPADTEFSIVIPKISANSLVEANVDPSNYDEYIGALKKGVAHARGTALPGDSGHMYLFAHSTDNMLNVSSYNAVFYLLYKLEPNDRIYIFYKNKKYAYKVIDKSIVDPTQVEYITKQSSKPFLTLQTCWPPGTTLKRLLVFATPVVQ
ncbi:MAG: sortase [Candidatus Roizmanbacteria bacterium]|nr:sortase [Candidatus Roizmanbacteria bacterium]